MAKYKYLSFKYIIPSILIIVLLVMLGLFFIGGLKKHVLAFDNDEFDYEGFTDFSILSSEEEEEIKANKNKLVAHNDKYVMMIDQTTTIVTIYRKKAGWQEANPTANTDLLYSSAQANGDEEAKSNIILTYVDENGNTTTINSYSKSVQYANTTTGTYNRYYQLRFNGDSVDVLYSIGEFSPIVIPDQFDRDDFNELFIGNTIFLRQSDSDISSYADVYDAADPDTLVNLSEKVVELKYTGLGYCYDNEAALYILKNNLGSIAYRLNENGTFVEGYSFDSAEVSAEDEEKILSADKGYWYLTNLLEADGTLKAKMGVNYNTETDESGNLISPVTTNPFLSDGMLGQFVGPGLGYEVRDIDEEGKTIRTPSWNIRNMDVSKRVLKYKLDTPIMRKKTYKFLYIGQYEKELVSGSEEDGTAKYEYEYAENYYLTSGSAYPAYQNKTVYIDWNQDGKIESNEQYQYGGYQLRDENGGFVYYTDEYGNKRPKQMGLLSEDAVKQNEKFGVDSVVATIAFDLCLRFELNDSGMDVSILHNSIKEGVGYDNTDPDVAYYLKHDKLIYKVQLCKYMTVNDDPNSTGEIILPDGSGCVIEFNSGKSQQYTFVYPEKRIYGSATAANAASRGNNQESLMFPMYGFIDNTNYKTVVAIVKEGAAQTSISADYLRDSKATNGLNKYNYAFFTTYYRETEKVKVTSSSEYTKISENIYQGDVTYSYRFMYGVKNYVDVAKEYRNYLLETYQELNLKKDTTIIGTPTITFLGAYTKKTFKLGIVYEGEYSMTTFDQAKDIVEELKANGVENMNVMYRSWTEDEDYQKVTSSIDVSNEIGGKKKMIEFSNYLKENGFGFYPEYHLTVGYGYDYSFGSLKYNSKSISGAYASALKYVLSTGLADTTGRKGAFISPVFYESLANKFIKNYKKLDISGIYLIDLGNRGVYDYNRSNTVYVDGSILYQREVLAEFKGVDNEYYPSFMEPTGNDVMLKNPFDYAFSYADVITCAPIQTSLYGSVSYSIPLYQLVLSGIADYSYNPVNYHRDNSITWNILKAIETGSNVAFVLTADDTNALLETSYTDYYNSYYP
ncbi:MAG: hypothetical protein J5666_01890, partial [Bacilli bacterium]|nr:hypothetical protein [Bacilli bacterium]